MILGTCPTCTEASVRQVEHPYRDETEGHIPGMLAPTFLTGRACLLLRHKLIIGTFRTPYWLKQWPGACHCLKLIWRFTVFFSTLPPFFGFWDWMRAVVVFAAFGGPPSCPNLPPAALREPHRDGLPIPVWFAVACPIVACDGCWWEC